MTGNQTFIFFNPAISHIIIDGKRLSTSGNKGLYLNGKNAIIDKFSEDTKYIVYFLPLNTCPLISIYAFGGKNNNIKFHNNNANYACVFIPTFDDDLEASYTFGSKYVGGTYKLVSPNGDEYATLYSNSLETLRTKEAFGIFYAPPSYELTFKRKLDMSDDSFVDECNKARIIQECSKYKLDECYATVEIIDNVVVDGDSCQIIEDDGGLAVGVIVAIVIIALIVIAVILVLICCGVCACCSIFKHKSSSSSSSSKKDFQEPIAINTGYQPQPGYQQPGYYQYPPQQTYVQEPAAPVYQQQPQVYQPQQPQNNEQQQGLQSQDPLPKKD